MITGIAKTALNTLRQNAAVEVVCGALFCLIFGLTVKNILSATSEDGYLFDKSFKTNIL
jgi:hypothetical protein